MQTETLENCPQCRDLIQDNAKRIIKDSCGHEKCRVCLLLDVDGCRQCLENKNNGYSGSTSTLPTSIQNSPIENHTTVITYNNLRSESQKQYAPPIETVDESTEVPESLLKSKKVSSYKIKSTSEKRSYNSISVPSHISAEGKPPMFTCNICNSQFKTKGHVKYHEFCLGEKKPFSCDICSKCFILKSQLYTHKLIHSGKKPHACIKCSKAFREPGTLKRHMILHSNERSHVCDECGKSFKALTYLKLHRMVHTGEKPFVCKYCKRKFGSSSNLKKHMVSHSDDRTHMCEQCGKKFKQKWALSVHRRSHLPERNYSCRECSRAFVNQKDLKRHELIHLDTKMYSCGLCSMSFRRKDNLGRHIRNAHPDKKAEIIKRLPEPSEKSKKRFVDNPNAINVITASPIVKKPDNTKEKVNSSPRTCMNGPLKLAVKTSAFKRNYNINRDYTFDSNSKGESTTTKNHSEVSEKLQSYPSPPSRIFPDLYSTSNLSVDEFYANRPHVIKNIKFKIPENYPSSNEAILKTIIPQTLISSGEKKSEYINGNQIGNERNTYNGVDTSQTSENVHDKCDIEPKNVPVIATSVIVSSNDQRNIHWRRRISQNVASEKL